MKNVNDIETFKTNNRKWKLVNRHCKLCLDYVSSIGYVNTPNSNAPFIEKPVNWFLLVGCGMLLFRGCFLSHFASGNWLPGLSVNK